MRRHKVMFYVTQLEIATRFKSLLHDIITVLEREQDDILGCKICLHIPKEKSELILVTLPC